MEQPNATRPLHPITYTRSLPRLIPALLFAAGLGAPMAEAQVPQTFSYQAVARDAGGLVVPNAPVGVQFQVHALAANGPVAYAETHTPTTNAQGLFQANVGQGTPTTGTFSAIYWNDGVFFVEVGLDPTGGTAYTTIGVQQLLSVPFALHADNAATSDTALYALESGPQGSAPGSIRYWDGSAWVVLPPPAESGTTLTYCAGSLQWGHCAVQARLDGGETPCQIANSGVPLDSLWGKNYLGGLIAYLDPNTCQGFVAATTDLFPFLTDWMGDPVCGSTFLGGTSTALFTGATNTTTVASNPACGAFSLAAAVLANSAPDWFLPSRDELLACYTNLYQNGLGAYAPGLYLTSSESSASQCWFVSFSIGSAYTDEKYNGAFGKVRPVKFF